MDHRRALGGILGLVVALSASAGLELSAAERADDGKVVVHKPDVRRVQAPRQGVAHVALRPDGRRLVTVASRDGEKVQVWHTGIGRERLAFGDGKGTDGLVVYSRDGTCIATCGTDGWNLRQNGFKMLRTPAGFAIKIWDAETGREKARIPANSVVLGMAFGTDGTTITTLDHENRLQVREIEGGREIANIKGNFPEANRNTGLNKWGAFDAKARRVALATTDIEKNEFGRETHEAVLKLWDVDKNEFRNVYLKKQLGLELVGGSCLLSPDGTLVVVTYFDFESDGLTGSVTGQRKVAILDFATLAVLRRTVREMESQEYLIAFSPDGKWFVSSRPDGSLRIWDVATGRIAWTIKGPEGMDIPRYRERTIGTRAVAFLPRGIRVVSGGIRGWNEVDRLTNRIIPDPATGEVLRVEPLQIWEAEFDWTP